MDHDQFFKLMMRLFLRDFFEVFYPEWLGRLRFEEAEWRKTRGGYPRQNADHPF
jgi:hypothetical protein